jgi:hypothetical protein
LVSTGGWIKQNKKTLAKTKGCQAVVTIDQCVSIWSKGTGSRRCFEIVFKSKIIYGIEVWGLTEAWKEFDKVRGRFQKLMGIPHCADSGFAEMELGGESRGGMLMRQAVKYWYKILCLGTEDRYNNVMHGREYYKRDI